MRKNIFEVLGKNLDFRSEFSKLEYYFNNKAILTYEGTPYTLVSLFNSFIKDWEYRGTYYKISEIIRDLNLIEDGWTKEEYLEKCLILIELILNVKEFLIFKQNELESIYNKTKESDEVDLFEDEVIEFYDSMLYENIEIIIKELGYKPIKIDRYKVLLIKNDSDVISTALIIEEKEISDLILEYNDIRIEKDLNRKKEILLALGQYIEPFRSKIKDLNKDIEDYIFYGLNNLHLRHNNKSGKNKVEYINKIKDKELLMFYDNLYDLILIAIRLIEMKNIFSEFDNLKDKCRKLENFKSVN